MIITTIILWALHIIEDWIIAHLIIMIAMIISAIYGSSAYHQCKYTQYIYVDKYIEKMNPFKPKFSLSKLIVWYICDTWFVLILIMFIIGLFIGRKRG